MARPAPSELDDETVAVPSSVRFPVELVPPEGFDPEDPATWPRVEGRLEWVAGRLLFMPPCGFTQQMTVTRVVFTLQQWAMEHPAFAVGTNEAGIRLGLDSRGADAVVWRCADLPAGGHKFVKAVPALAVEVAGGDEEPEAALREKARWYLAQGVPLVWLVLPDERKVVVVTPHGESSHGAADALPPSAALPDLVPLVEELLPTLNPR
jgi:Uma2 family endonuclease